MTLERKAETSVSFEKAVSKLLGKPEATNSPTLQHTSTNTCAKNCSAIAPDHSVILHSQCRIQMYKVAQILATQKKLQTD